MTYHQLKISERNDYAEVVDLDEVKNFIRVDHNDDDQRIQDMTKDVRRLIERVTKKALVASSVSFWVEATQGLATLSGPQNKFLLLFGDTRESLKITSEDATELTENTHYKLMGDYLWLFVDGWYKVSYDVVPNDPDLLRDAVLMEIAQRYNNRGENDKNNLISEGAKQIIQSNGTYML